MSAPGRGDASAGEHEQVADARVRELLDRYVALSGAALVPLGPCLFQLTVPASDTAAFARRSVVRLAYSVEALQQDSRAEMAIVGSAFVNQLIEAVRLRGTRYLVARLDPGLDEDLSPLALPIPLRGASAGVPESRFVRHRIGRLTARVAIRAGTGLDEHLAVSDPVDLCTGLVLTDDIAAACTATWETAGANNDVVDRWRLIECAPIRPMGDLVSKMLVSLERQLRPQIDAMVATAAHELALELGRIDRYYKALLDDIGGRESQIPDADSRAVFQAEHARRSIEEKERHAVRATVHPVQLSEWEVGVERAEWTMESMTGHRAAFVAQRILVGDKRWALGCPNCGVNAPSELAVCYQEHVSCSSCSNECSVCHEYFCTAHGVAACHVDGAPACGIHSRTCKSCRRVHCSTHEGTCDETGHDTCSSCLALCAHCKRVICDKHAAITKPEAPLGTRRLCSRCVRTCEGGTGEIVGPDEVTGCASCDRVVCVNHQARCSVDGKVHCSAHLRRADASRRLVCEKHRALCTYEPNAILATDEVCRCESCQKMACYDHSQPCEFDGKRHCTTHMASIGDKPGVFACESHRSICHVDRATFSLAGTSTCPSCGRLACSNHLLECSKCGRRVCSLDFTPGKQLECATCSRLAVNSEPPDDVVAAVLDLRGADAGRPKAWRMARDARHLLVELDLGWTRRLVFAVPHGDSRAEVVVSHTLFGKTRLRG